MLHLSPTLTTMARNAWGLSFGRGVDRAAPTPSVIVHDAAHRVLHRYRNAEQSVANPVLLVPPLAVPMSCYDFRPGQSLVEYLSKSGRTSYLVDYGTMTYVDRGLGFEDWVDDIVPETIRRVSSMHGGRPVDVLGWSLGGTVALLTAAAHPELPIHSITAVGTPIDYRRVPALAPVRAFGRVLGDRPVAAASRVMGGLPGPLVQASYRVTALQREMTKLWFITRNLHQTEALARMETTDRFIAAMPGYPGRFFRQCCSRLIFGNELADGHFRLGSRTIELASVTVPVLAIGGADDAIAPVESVRPITSVLTGTADVRYETAPGRHLGLLTGPAARTTTWAYFTDFLDSVAAPESGVASSVAGLP